MVVINFFTIAGQPQVINPGSFGTLLKLLDEPKMGIAKPETITELGSEVSGNFFTVPSRQTKGENRVNVSFNKEKMKVFLHFVCGTDLKTNPIKKETFDAKAFDVKLMKESIRDWLYPKMDD